MLRRISGFIVLALSLFATIQISPAQSGYAYTSAQLTTNNTAACSGEGYGLQISPGNAPAYCADVFPCSSISCMSGGSWPYAGGWKDDQTIESPFVVSTPYHDPTPAGDASENPPGNWNIAKGRLPENQGATPPPFVGDMHTLMYGGNYTTVPNTKVVLELQGWFCNGVQNDGDCPEPPPAYYEPDIHNPQQWVPQYYGHADVQLTGWDQDVANARVIDAWDRGGDTFAADWYGGPQDCPPLPTTQSPQYTYTGSGNVYTNYCDYADTASGNKFGDDDLGFQHVMTALQNTLPAYRPGADMTMFLIMDHGAWTWDCGPNTYNDFQYFGANEPWCAAGKMINDLEYLKATYYEPNGQISSTYTTYTTPGVGTFPIIAFFQSEANDFSQCGSAKVPQCLYGPGQGQYCTTPATCFQQVYALVRTEANTLFGTNSYYFIFNSSEGCPAMTQNGQNNGHPDSDGCYAWPGPWVPSDHKTDTLTEQTQGYSYCTGTWVQNSIQGCNSATGGLEVALDNFYYNSVKTICAANGGVLNGCKGYGGNQLVLMGGASKGFDDLMTNNSPTNTWYEARIATQGCGTTWMNSWGEMSEYAEDNYVTNYYSQAENPLPWMMVATWDDYEEGTEIETGIDNCILSSSFVPILSGNTLSWSFSFDTQYRDPNETANPTTIDHYDIYYASGDNYYLVSHSISAGQAGCTFNKPTVSCTGIDIGGYGLPSNSTVFVEAIGKPGITNWLSQGVPYP